MDSVASDYALARLLQEQFDREGGDDDGNDVLWLSGIPPSEPSRVETPTPMLRIDERCGNSDKPSAITDDTWEMIDPNPDARALFMEFNQKYFWGKLDGVEVRWSPRMTLCAGLCQYEGRGGLCSIRLSEALLKFRPRKDLIETLLHEMIHAYLFVTNNDRDREGHGPEFQKHMHRLNKETGSHITVYHNFHDEVDNYRQHWWRCTGPCRDRKPFFGYVRRAMNRAPSSHDTWWADHQNTCGGMFIKIKEPEDYGVKKKKNTAEKDKSLVAKTESVHTLDSWCSAGDGSKPKASSSKTLVAPAVAAVSSASTESFAAESPSDCELMAVVNNVEKEYASQASPVRSTNATSPRKSDDRIIPFTGHGHIMGKSPSASSAGPLVRHLPGIGVVSSERYFISNGLKSSSDDLSCQVNKSSDLKAPKQNIILEKFEDSQSVSQPIKLLGSTSRSCETRTLSEFRQGLRMASLPVGTSVRVKKFRSVSNPKARPGERWRDPVPAPSPMVRRNSIDGDSDNRPSKKLRAAEPAAESKTQNVFLVRADEMAAKLLPVRDADDKQLVKKFDNSSKDDKKLILSCESRWETSETCRAASSLGAEPVEPSSGLKTSPTLPDAHTEVIQGSITNHPHVEYVECPVCSIKIAALDINEHLDMCLV